MKRPYRTAYAGAHRVEVRTRSRPAPHADQRHPVCLGSGPPAIHQHLAPLPQCRDGTTQNSCQLFMVVFKKDASGVSALQHFRNIVSPVTFRPTECLSAPSVLAATAERAWTPW